MSEEQNPFWLVGRATLGTNAKVSITKNPDAPSAIPSPSEAMESARKQARAELRDRFAGHALEGLLAAGDAHAYNRDEMAAEAWRQADAMLKARGDE